MRITTLGTSHGDATPTRHNSAILVEVDDDAYLIEAGEPVCATLIRGGFDFGRLRAVFLTHMHGDHAGGLPILIKGLLKYRKPHWRCQIHLPEAEGIPALRGWMQALHLADPEPTLSFHAISPGPTFADDTIRLSAIPTEHPANGSALTSYAYVLEAAGKRVLFTGDLCADFHDFPALDEPVDLGFCEATHAPLDAILAALRPAPLRRLVLTHIGPRWDGGNEDALRQGADTLPFPTTVASDGDEFLL
jgi:ribonuclease BN (tRNA processing enzyme)